MKTTTKNTLQAVRLSAARHQFNALTNQALAIEKLHTEHNQGIDLGVDPEVLNILTQSERMIGRLQTIIKKAEKKDGIGVQMLLTKIVETADYLQQHAGHFRKHGSEKARAHFQELMSEPGKGAPFVANPDSSFLQASKSCFRAEDSQYTTFQMQVLALANLAKEIGYLAADETSVDYKRS